MGVRGYVQKQQAEHDMNVCLTSWAQPRAAEFLAERNIEICCGDEAAEYADKWEIPIPGKRTKGGKYVIDPRRIESAVRYLRKHPKAIDGNGEYAGSLADLLERGLEVARKKGYTWIIIDWF